MKIYLYSDLMLGRYEKNSTWEGIFKISEVEAEEKNKTFKLTNGGIIKKENIGKFTGGWHYEMYLTERNDDYYINAVINSKISSVKSLEERLHNAKKSLEEWEEFRKQKEDSI